jgi:peptidoglycan hydrolase-like protein with peptidoglycan-binding domain
VSTSATRDTPVGHWANFRIAAGLSPKPAISAVSSNPNVVKTAEDGTDFTYVLLTAREVRLASENMGTPPTDLKFFKLRRGSQGDTVRALQTALGLNADGDFGYLTQRALIEKQLALGQAADGVVTSANAAALGIA